MAPPTLAALISDAAAATDPAVTPKASLAVGGVDPLGLRPLNFDLMDEVLPGLSNVARHVRPFVVVAWAWRRAGQLAATRGQNEVSRDLLIDFVDRIETLFVASHLLGTETPDLPGSEFLKPLVGASTIEFGGDEWAARRKKRRDSTSLSAAINYGPGLKSLGWAVPHPEAPRVLVLATQATAALDAFEARIHAFLNDPAFSQLGPVSVSRTLLGRLAEAWRVDDLTEDEKRVGAELLFGSAAPAARQSGGALMLSAARAMGTRDPAPVRAAMAGSPSAFKPPASLLAARDAWRRVQVRQLFRLSLEALLFWVVVRLERGPQPMSWLVRTLLTECPPAAANTPSGEWLASLQPEGKGPTELIDDIAEALRDPDGSALATSIFSGLAFVLAEPVPASRPGERDDRLPVRRARTEADQRRSSPRADLARHILESWVLAQHAYWSIGRGLADARAGGKVILRLKVTLDDGGWTLAPGSSRGHPPGPTPDRLATALSLAYECGLLGAIAT